MAEERFGSVVFRQNFDSGNFGSVEKIENSNEDDLLEFKVWTRPDCAGSRYENGNRTWFHFRFLKLSILYWNLEVRHLLNFFFNNS